MKNNVRSVTIAAACCLAAIVAWNLAQENAEVPVDAAEGAVVVASQSMDEPEWFASESSESPRAVEAAAPAEAAETKPAIDHGQLTAETLKDTRWKEGNIDVVFMADGRWQMNGRICAQWEVLGDRIRIFDDNGEEHFVNIVGDSIAFNGKKIGRIEADAKTG